jgi:hypothetical protein
MLHGISRTGRPVQECDLQTSEMEEPDASTWQAVSLLQSVSYSDKGIRTQWTKHNVIYSDMLKINLFNTRNTKSPRTNRWFSNNVNIACGKPDNFVIHLWPQNNIDSQIIICMLSEVPVKCKMIGPTNFLLCNNDEPQFSQKFAIWPHPFPVQFHF